MEEQIHRRAIWNKGATGNSHFSRYTWRDAHYYRLFSNTRAVSRGHSRGSESSSLDFEFESRSFSVLRSSSRTQPQKAVQRLLADNIPDKLIRTEGTTIQACSNVPTKQIKGGNCFRRELQNNTGFAKWLFYKIGL